MNILIQDVCIKWRKKKIKVLLPNNTKKNKLAFKNSLSEYCIFSSLKKY